MKNEGKDIDEKEASESAVELNDLCRGNIPGSLEEQTFKAQHWGYILILLK